MKKILVVLIVLCTFGCKKYVVSFEQPTNSKLDNVKLEILLDKEKVQEINLKVASGIPGYETVELPISDEGKHLLQIKAKDTTFSYEIKYPEEQYIRVISHLKTDGKLHVGILKRQYNF